MPSPQSVRPLRGASLALCALTLIGCARACQRTSGPAAAREDLAMVPRETDIVVMANLKRARASVLWKKLLELRDREEATRQPYEEFTRKCQFDPLQQIDSIFLALPRDTADSREFALIARGSFDGKVLLECLRRLARESGKQVTETQNGARTIYSVAGQEGYFTVVSPGTVLLGGRQWVRRVLDLSDDKDKGRGAKENQALSDIIRRTRTGDALWGAGLVPPGVADRLRSQPQLGAAASMTSVSGALDFDQGMLLHVNIDLGAEKDAAELAAKINEQLQSGRKDRNVQLLGLSSYFDTIKVEAKGLTLTARIDLTQAQVDDLSTRLSGLLKTLELGGGRELPALPSSLGQTRPEGK